VSFPVKIVRTSLFFPDFLGLVLEKQLHQFFLIGANAQNTKGTAARVADETCTNLHVLSP
jgi:hypothetical protein